MTQEIELAQGAISIAITNHGEAIPRQDVREMVGEFKLNFKTANFPDKLEARVVISRANLPGRPIGLTFVGAVVATLPSRRIRKAPHRTPHGGHCNAQRPPSFFSKNYPQPAGKPHF